MPWKSQVEVVHSLLSSVEACRELYGVLLPHHFENPALGRVADIAIRLGVEQGTPATEGQIQEGLAGEAELTQCSALSVLAECLSSQVPPPSWAAEMGRQMAASSALATLATEAPGYAEKGAFDAFAEEARKVAAAAGGKGNSTFGTGDIESRHDPKQVLGIKTGVHRLDLCMRGHGWLPGQLILILAPDGGGKSHCAISFGTAALHAGLRVHDTTLEMDEGERRARYDRAIAGVGSDEFWVKLPSIKPTLDAVHSRLTILAAVDRPLTVSAWEAEVLRLPPERRPDLLIVDSGYLMSSGEDFHGDGAAQAQRNALSLLHQRLRIAAQRLGCPVITPFQANREGLKKMYGASKGEERDVLTRADMADALSVSRHADIVLSLNQNFHEYAAGTGRIWIDKARGGKQFEEIPCKFKWGMSRVTDLQEGM